MMTHAQPCSPPPGTQPAGRAPRFSVVVPAYNEAALLGSCLDSLLGQDFADPYEIIVVDNNSTDGTADLARARGVRVVPENRPGVCWARQCGTALAAGEIVISTDADTVHGSDWLTRIDQAFRLAPERVAVAGPCRFADAPWWGRAYAWTLFHLVGLVARMTGRVCYVSATNIAFRKSAWPGYDTRVTQGGDELDLLRRLRPLGPVAFDLGNPVFTSARRMRRGLAYNIAVTFFFYYLLGYGLNRLTGRTVVGMAPAVRGSARRARRGRTVPGLADAAAWLLLAALVGDLALHLAGRL
jgi:glycosyltransferase involved in cell wall biosynthesis